MAIGGVVINFAARTRDAISDIDKLTRSLGDTDDKSRTLGGSLKKGLAVGAAVAGTALVGLGAAALDWGKAALEDKQSADKLANTLRNIKGVTDANIAANEAWITSMQLATLVSDTELRAAVGKLTLVTGDLSEAQKLAALATDVAAGSGKNYAAVTDALAKAAAGNTAQLQRQFPWLDKNKDGTVTLAEATKGLGTAYEGAAAKAAKNDPWTQLQVIWGELKESLGQWLLPLIKRFGDWFADPKNRKNIQDIIDKVGDLSKQVGEKLVTAISDFLEWVASPEGKKALRDFTTALQNMATAAGSIYRALEPVLGLLDDLLRLWARLPAPLKGLAGLGEIVNRPRSAAAGTTNTGPAQHSTGTTPPPPPAVIVTEEQIYRAVSRLILRGEARNGRAVAYG